MMDTRKGDEIETSKRVPPFPCAGVGAKKRIKCRKTGKNRMSRKIVLVRSEK